MSLTVSAVILSYNSIDSLNVLLKAVLNQTYAIQKVYLIDNGTPQAAWNKLVIPSGLSVEITRLEKNYGVGYGHTAGWQKALENSVDFIWALEHDNVPRADCLEQLIRAYQQMQDNKKIGAVHPIEAGSYDLSRFAYYRFKGLFVKRIKDYARTGKPTFGFGTSFNGTLFLRSVIEQIGFPRADFFVGLEDNEYSQRLNKNSLKVLKVPAAVVEHDLLKQTHQIKMGNNILVLAKTSRLRTYYVIRNSIFMSKHNLYFAASKNKYNLIFFLLRLPVVCMKDMFTSVAGYKMVCCRVQALLDGRAGKMGKQEYWFMK